MPEEKADWDYKADESKTKASKRSNRTISWTASEFIDHKRGVSWYLMLASGAVVLAGLVYVITKDRFATAVIIVVGLIVGSTAHWKPKQVEYQISPEGLQVGDKQYSYGQFKTFSIVHESQLSSLVFHPLKRFMPPLSIFFDEDNEEKITAVVGKHLPLEERPPDRIDRLSRRLRF